MGGAISGFFAKLFSTDSIVSRLVRALLLGIVGSGTEGTTIPGAGVHLPSWALALIGIIIGMIPAGQNQSSPATPTAKKAIPPQS